MQRDYTLNALDYDILIYLRIRTRTKRELISKFNKDICIICLDEHLHILSENGYISLYHSNSVTSKTEENAAISITEKGIVASESKSYERKYSAANAVVGAIITALITCILSNTAFK